MNRETLKDRILLKNWRRKLTPKQVALFKLVVWCCLLVWMTFFMTHAVIIAKILGNYAPLVVGEGNWQQAVGTMIPYWYVFTVALIIVLVARYSYRKLRGAKPPNNKRVIKTPTKPISTRLEAIREAVKKAPPATQLKFQYDREADVLYILFNNKPYSHGKDLDSKRHIDYSADGKPIGLELLHVSNGVLLNDLPHKEQVETILRSVFRK